MDDNSTNRLILEEMTRNWGMQTGAVGSAREAISVLRQAHKMGARVQLVLSDVNMPEVDGLEATAVIRVKERQAGKHVPIIAMTAHAMKGDRERCLEAGMDDYVSKPIRAQQLFETLESVLGNRRR